MLSYLTFGKINMIIEKDQNRHLDIKKKKNLFDPHIAAVYFVEYILQIMSEIFIHLIINTFKPTLLCLLELNQGLLISGGPSYGVGRL